MVGEHDQDSPILAFSLRVVDNLFDALKTH